jgi:hypothetical protein
LDWGSRKFRLLRKTPVGIALDNKLGPLYGQTVNFLADAAQGMAVYSASTTR